MDRVKRIKKDKNADKRMKITNSFPVVKRSLFQTSPESISPDCKKCIQSPFLDEDKENEGDSPFSLYQTSKVFKSKSNQQNSESSTSRGDETPFKESNIVRRRICDIQMQSPENSKAIKLALQKDLVTLISLNGDMKPCILPTVQGKHPELNSVTPDVVVNLLSGKYPYKCTLIDCRYPYEYEGGHIHNAINLYHTDLAEENFFNSLSHNMIGNRDIWVFYCEFSSERAPNMMRYIRQRDRKINTESYPALFYPEIYLLEGGYKSFFSSFKMFCEPQSYLKMVDKRFTDKLAEFRKKSKVCNLFEWQS
ncbi:m-phase inducer phosphatase 2 [Caerostris extrusa]|uniref:M-phase inducer phosphatase n=1 Tax=Caerostris extrusa TaxID=172846 RepID=A0AAV4Q115_CAEEX|nr:m-phase inducer phosphatase 2 [Caerostris extrusa]